MVPVSVLVMITKKEAREDEVGPWSAVHATPVWRVVNVLSKMSSIVCHAQSVVSCMLARPSVRFVYASLSIIVTPVTRLHVHHGVATIELSIQVCWCLWRAFSHSTRLRSLVGKRRCRQGGFWRQPLSGSCNQQSIAMRDGGCRLDPWQCSHCVIMLNITNAISIWSIVHRCYIWATDSENGPSVLNNFSKLWRKNYFYIARSRSTRSEERTSLLFCLLRRSLSSGCVLKRLLSKIK